MLSFIPITVVMLGCLQIVSGYNVGTGIYDVTGPSVEINFMGYAVPGQRGTGIHMRLKARAFAFEDEEKRFVFVSVDGGMGSDLVNFRVVEKLNAALGEGVYSMDSISISGTHTHSGPAGFLQYVLYQMTSLGFVQETFDAWVDGITQAILLAHANLARGRVMLSQGPLYGANINRSPTSYLLNPSEERAKYDGDTDKNMFLLNLLSGDKPVGVLNWFAVHGTSMNNTNTLTSGDNRGYASYALERLMNGPSKAGKGAFVAAFASSNLGDVSPNTNGAKCIDTGLDCDGTSSTCNGRCENCIAFGPGEDGDMFQSTQIIGDKQFQHAVGLMDAGEEVSGKIDYRHSWVKMSELNVTLGDGSSVQLCSPAMGYSFAAGTTDGPGMFNFAQGTTTDSPFWDRVRDFLSTPTDLEIACQAPKPILLNTGDVEKPYEWDPETVPVQILRLGNVFVLSVPGELTTMAGRRLREAVGGILQEGGILTKGEKGQGGEGKEGEERVQVVIAGLANSYSSYIVTYEEYQAQRYEAASTIFGPHTLQGYIQEFSRLARDMVANRASETGPPPPDMQSQMIDLMPLAHADRAPMGKKFGEVVEGKDVLASYKVGQTVEVSFHGANPRNDIKPTSSFMTVERADGGSKDLKGFNVVATDADWETKFSWKCGKDDPLQLGFARTSEATLAWAIPAGEGMESTYRLCYSGDHKVAHTDRAIPFSGCSSTFEITV